MKNTNLKEIRAQELAAREAAAQEAQKQAEQEAHIAELEALPEKGSVDTISGVRDGSIRSDRTEDGSIRGINGGKYFTKMVDGELITAETEEELKEIEERVKKGIHGDGFLYRDVTILGHRFTLTGKTEEELDEDLRKAEVDIYSHKDHFVFDVTTAEDLHNSGYTEKDLEEVMVRGHKFLISYPEFRAINIDFDKYATAVEVTDIPSVVAAKNRDEIKKLLLERLEAYVTAKEAELTEDKHIEDDSRDEDWDTYDYDWEQVEDDFGLTHGTLADASLKEAEELVGEDLSDYVY